jgi:hypothetical protein
MLSYFDYSDQKWINLSLVFPGLHLQMPSQKVGQRLSWVSGAGIEDWIFLITTGHWFIYHALTGVELKDVVRKPDG